VKVLDFGLAKLMEKPATEDTDTVAVTRALVQSDAGMVLGTSQYMSPEQARGKPVDARTDIWSLGVVLYEMAAGRPPFHGETKTDVIVAIARNDPPPITRFVPNAPAEFERILWKALRKDVDERYQSMRELSDDLRQLNARLAGQQFRKREHLTVVPVYRDEGIVRARADVSPPEVITTVVTTPNQSRPVNWSLLIFGIVVLFALLVGASLGLVVFIISPRPPPQFVRNSDGDPPEAQVASLEMRKAIDDEIKVLEPGQILFNPASEMKVGVVEIIDVRIAHTLVDGLNNGLTGLKGTGRPQIEDIKVGPNMGVVLSGTQGFFNIQLKNREQKVVSEHGYTEWIFDVTPLRPGQASLYLTAYNVIVTPTGEKTYEHPALSKEIKVTTTLAVRAADIVKANWWKEIASLAIASGLITWVVNRIRKRRHNQSRPWENP
jgi:hypothetical protein